MYPLDVIVFNKHGHSSYFYFTPIKFAYHEIREINNYSLVFLSVAAAAAAGKAATVEELLTKLLSSHTMGVRSSFRCC